MAKFQEFAFMDATRQAELLRRKEVTPVELVDAAIGRIERMNPVLNAVVTPMYEQAREAAQGVLPEGRFRGVPFLLKDLVASYAGVRMTCGSAFLRDFVPDHDSELVRRLKRAGLVIVGKTNTPELGIVPTTEPLSFGPTRNPWDLKRSTGGSSGGSAAAVAAGIVPVAHANDGGGSIRIPASCCGVFGLKPTRARNPLGPELGDIMGGLVAEHVVSRSVRDSAALLDCLAGPEVGDPYWAPPPVRSYAEEVAIDPGRLRIAFSTRAPTGAKIHPDCVEAVRDAAGLCVDLGHEVSEGSPDINGALLVQAFTSVWAAGCAAAIDGFALLAGSTPKPDCFEPLTWALYETGHRTTGPAYLMSQAILQQIARQIGRFMEKFDVWLTPTLAEPPLLLGSFDATPDDPMRGFRRAVDYVPFTPIANATGQPAMSVPLYWNKEGLPVGAHFFGRFGEEGTLFRLAAQLEASRPWDHRRPPVQG
ncbi:MAG TPA: amidase [Terriglobia bacterium]|nr:amidase [Terriglobia bacterium]